MSDELTAAQASDLARLFRTVQAAMEAQRQAFNQADEFNGNHGDHMVEIFEIAARASEQQGGIELAAAMERAGQWLVTCIDNGSAQVYARGLAALAEQFRKHEISLQDLLAYVRGVTHEKSESKAPQAKSGPVLKALMGGLADWQGAEEGKATNGLSLGYLFDLGVAYMQAKGHGGSRVEVIAEAAAAASPLKDVSHRRMSGKAVILALLKAMGETK
jgi:hypothetical protein